MYPAKTKMRERTELKLHLKTLAQRSMERQRGHQPYSNIVIQWLSHVFFLPGSSCTTESFALTEIFTPQQSSRWTVEFKLSTLFKWEIYFCNPSLSWMAFLHELPTSSETFRKFTSTDLNLQEWRKLWFKYSRLTTNSKRDLTTL